MQKEYLQNLRDVEYIQFLLILRKVNIKPNDMIETN